MNPAPRHDTSKRREFAGLAAVLALALALRFFRLGQMSVCNDDYYCLVHFPADSLGAFLKGIATQSPDMPPLYFSLLYGWTHLFGVSPESARVFSILPSVGCAVLLFSVTRRLFGGGAGLLAALIFSLSPLHIFYAQDIRVYPLMCLLGLVSARAFLGMLEGKSPWWWPVCALANVLLIHTHLFGALLAAVEFLFLAAFHRRAWGRVAGWTLSQGLCVAPLLPWILRLLGAGGAAPGAADAPVDTVYRAIFQADVSRLTWSDFDPAWTAFVSGAAHDTRMSWIYMARDHTEWMLFIAFAVFVWRLLRWRNTDPDAPRETPRLPRLFVLAWFLGPPVMLYALSRTVLPENAFAMRYFMESQVAAYVIIGGAAALIRRPGLRRVYAAAAVAAFSVAACCELAFPPRGDYLGTIQHLKTELPPDRGIVLACVVSDEVFRFNQGSDAFPVSFARTPEALTSLLEDALAAHGEVWFCLDTRSTPNEEHALFAAFEQFVARHGLRTHARAALGQPSLFVCHAWSPDRPPADRPGCRSPFE